MSDPSAWFAPATERLRALPNADDASLATLFDRRRPVTIARAPGRLDVMGGIADYSGSLVLEMPLACGTFASAQQQDAPRLDVVSLRGDRAVRFGVDLAELIDGSLRTSDALAASFASRPDDRWAAYVVGSVYACLTSVRGRSPRNGLRLLITSTVPEGKGVSSSAALEVATMAVTAASYGIPMAAEALAIACQWAENHIAGAPCGIMDQMTSALGRQDRLLRLLCQPATVEGYVSVPAGYRFYGIDSGVRHAVSGADYGTVRTAAFMGYRMIADLAGFRVTPEPPRVRVDDERWHGYLANIAPAELAARYAEQLPERMRGAEFLARYAGITDHVTRVDPERWYPVRQAASHPVYEHARVTKFAELLAGGLERLDVASEMGALMVESHRSYSACGLGSEGTDRLVELAVEAGPARGVFGAKITGGGSGGTVCVFATDPARGVVRDIAREYTRETGREAIVFDESGPGADELGTLVISIG